MGGMLGVYSWQFTTMTEETGKTTSCYNAFSARIKEECGLLSEHHGHRMKRHLHFWFSPTPAGFVLGHYRTTKNKNHLLTQYSGKGYYGTNQRRFYLCMRCSLQVLVCPHRRLSLLNWVVSLAARAT